jgi:hypothetical protein
MAIYDVTQGLSSYSFLITGIENGDLSDLSTGYYDPYFTFSYIFSMGELVSSSISNSFLPMAIT